MKKAQRDMVMTIRSLRRVIGAGERTVAEIVGIKNEIANDRSRSDEWKRTRTAAAQQEQNEQLRKLGGEAAVLIDRFMEQVDAARQSFDYRDPDFTKAVGLVNALGKAMPVELSLQVADSFKGNLGGLKALKAIYEANGIDVQHLDGLITPLDSLGVDDRSAIDEFLGYARSDLTDANEWRTGAIKSMLDKYEGGFGIDSSISPYVADLEALRDNPNTRADVRGRVESWLKYHSEGLEADDPHEIAMTENRMATWTAEKNGVAGTEA